MHPPDPQTVFNTVCRSILLILIGPIDSNAVPAGSGKLHPNERSRLHGQISDRQDRAYWLQYSRSKSYSRIWPSSTHAKCASSTCEMWLVHRLELQRCLAGAQDSGQNTAPPPWQPPWITPERGCNGRRRSYEPDVSMAGG